MKHDFIPHIDPTPELERKECRFFAFVLMLFLKFGAAIFALLVWYLSDFYYGISYFLVFFL